MRSSFLGGKYRTNTDDVRMWLRSKSSWTGWLTEGRNCVLSRKCDRDDEDCCPDLHDVQWCAHIDYAQYLMQATERRYPGKRLQTRVRDHQLEDLRAKTQCDQNLEALQLLITSGRTQWPELGALPPEKGFCRDSISWDTTSIHWAQMNCANSRCYLGQIYEFWCKYPSRMSEAGEGYLAV